MNKIRIPVAALLILAVAACANMTVRDHLAQAETAYAAVVNTAANMRELGLIDEETAERLTPIFEEANAALERAHQAVVNGDFGAADEHVTTARALIRALSRRLEAL
jgi:cob(I)alamin adenosyltransferase